MRVSGWPAGRSESSAAVVLIFYHFEIKEQHLGVEHHPGPTTAAGCCRQCFASCRLFRSFLDRQHTWPSSGQA